jgi:alkyl sulfatase BDS1-like metallo-beta-lactamase superfamily hydrolase
MISALTLDMIFDYMAVRLNGPKAAGKELDLLFHMTDSDSDHTINLSNSVLHHRSRAIPAPDVTISTTRNGLIALVLLGTPPQKLMEAGVISVEGDESALLETLALLESFEFWFNIVTP